MALELLSSTSYVETPFVIARVGEFSFGVYSKEVKNIIKNNLEYRALQVTYPNFVDSLTVTKINGTLNTYTLSLTYAITQGDDPNLIDKVFSKVKNDRTIILSYGDLSIPTYIYKEEEALITKVTNSINVNNSSITYQINCVSKALNLSAGTFSFPKLRMKPSDRIKEILYNNQYGLLDIFYGMRDKSKVLARSLILADDKIVDIEAKKSISPIEYLKYLVNCMISVQDVGNNVVNNSKYTLTIFDDIKNEFNGPYFKTIKISDTTNEQNSSDVYTIDIGYPGQNIVTSFSVNDDETYSLLYDYSEKIDQSKYIYRINNKGEMEQIYSPSLTNSEQLMKTTSADKTWWTQVTQYPITATLTIKGLLRPAILMTYIKINVWFYGRKHISSGTYIITKQQDTISAGGYRTTLSLTRVQGDKYDY